MPYVPRTRLPQSDCPPVIRVEDDPNDSNRVIVTTAGPSRGNMTVRAFLTHYRLTPTTEILSDRVSRRDG